MKKKVQYDESLDALPEFLVVYIAPACTEHSSILVSAASKKEAYLLVCDYGRVVNIVEL